MSAFRTLRSLVLLPATPRMRWLLAAFIVAFGSVFVFRITQGKGDFDGFWRAGRHVLETGTLSVEKNVSRYLPTFQIVMLPFALLPVWAAAVVWYLLNVFALLALPGVLHRLTGLTPRQQRAPWIIMTFIIWDNLMLGQSGPLILWGAVWAAVFLRDGAAARGGGVIAVATLAKILPVVLLGIPLVMARSRAALLWFLLAVGAGVLISMVFVSGSDLAERTEAWEHTNRTEQTPWGMTSTGRSLRNNNQGIGAILARSLGDLGPVEHRAQDAVTVANLPLSVVWTIFGVLAAVLVFVGLATLPAAWRLRDQRAWFEVLALACLTMLLASPVVWTHYFLWALPGFLCVVHRPRFLLTCGTIFMASTVIEPLRALGFPMWSMVGLFLVITSELRARARGHEGSATGAAVA